MTQKLSPNLTGIPETMLWTLHNRAAEAKRSDTYLPDPECVRIYDAISYDFRQNFGVPDDSHPMRSKLFDEALLDWMKQHPAGSVVELAAGLETQFQRCDNGKIRWYCVDVPEAIAIRRRFLPDSERCTYIEKSALDFSWMDEVKAQGSVFVSAQGLLMYFEEKDVRLLLREISARFQNVVIMFDTIPKWFSKKSLKGFGKTKKYTAPKMPWGIGRDQAEKVIRAWLSRELAIKTMTYGFARGFKGKIVLPLFSSLPGLRNMAPAIVQIRQAQ